MTEIVDWNKRSAAENSAILQKVALRKIKSEQSIAEIGPTTAITQAEWQAAKVLAQVK